MEKNYMMNICCKNYRKDEMYITINLSELSLTDEVVMIII